MTMAMLLSEGITLDPPLGLVRWTDHPADVARKVPALTRGWDVRTSGPFELSSVSSSTMPVRARFAWSRDLLVSVRLTPTEDAQGDRPLPIEEAVQTFGAAILARRANRAALGAPDPDPGRPHPQPPCPTARWTQGTVVVVHEVYFGVERGCDTEGYLTDLLVVTRDGP